MIGSNSNTKRDKDILDDTSQLRSNNDEDESETEGGEDEEQYESSEHIDDLSDSEEELLAHERLFLSIDTKIVISASFKKEIYLHVLANAISLHSTENNHFDIKLERMVDLYEMVILLCQGICLPSLLKVVSGEDISEYPNNIKLPDGNKSYELAQSCTAILSGDYEYFLKTHHTFLEEFGINTKANANSLHKVLKCILLAKGKSCKINE